ncbi:diaminopimelate epimerase [Actinomycetota bacterium]|nr:diaminopimelate epimerase [Actinomycetota bacterium]
MSDTLYKAQGTGNDFVVMVDIDNRFVPTPEYVQQVCDRHYGFGGDGFIRIGNIDGLFFMDYWNEDGSIAQMCGNGVRCTAAVIKYLDLFDFKNTLRMQTRAGVRLVDAVGDDFCVDMGEYKATEYVDLEYCTNSSVSGHSGVAVVKPALYVDMGNPHLVIELSSIDELEAIDLAIIPKYATTIFNLQNQSNFEFYVQVEDKLVMRVYERGVGETLSCGTGVSAVAVHNHLHHHVDHIKVQPPGGILDVQIIDSRVILTGPAVVVGEFTLNIT